jgi:transcription initiation factor TFIID subunit 6
LLPKGPNANPHLAAVNGLDNVNVKPLVKHVLSKESQELFAKLSSALIDETNSEWQNAALASIQSDPGVHQLTTYIITFIAEKVTHNMKNLFVLRQMMLATTALLNNQAIYLDPYIPYMVPPVLTCCTGKHLGPSITHHVPSSNASSETLNGNVNGNSSSPLAHYELRELAASILSHMCSRYSASNQGLRARVARICLKQFMDPNRPLGTHYGALKALLTITGTEGLKMLVLPNLTLYDTILKEAINDESKKPEAERVLAVILEALDKSARASEARVNGVADLGQDRERLAGKVGEVLTEKIISSGRSAVVQLIMKTDLIL